MTIFCIGNTEAVRYAQRYLSQLGYNISQIDPSSTTHLLLDVPSFGAKGHLRCGVPTRDVLHTLPKDVILCGGNLDQPEIAGYRKIDLLKDEVYLAHNAYLTAEAALDIALSYLAVTMRDCPILICGWGRIGKCLSLLLKQMGAAVTVAARKETDRAALRSLGFHTSAIDRITNLEQYRLIFNSVPAPVLSEAQLRMCREDCVKIDLASTPGMEGNDIVHANGLPGIHLPESSGKLIAERLDYYFKKEVSP